MEHIEEFRNDLMGQFHNSVIALMDTSQLTVPEVLVILRMIASNTEKLFELAVKGKE